MTQKGKKVLTLTSADTLPEALKRRGLFCLWKYEEKDGRQTKMPYNPNRPQDRAKSNDRSTFAPLEIVLDRAAGFDGIGIGVFDDIAGIDIDHCIDDSGQLSTIALDIVQTMNAYTEISPSGKGLRILFLAPGFSYDKDLYYIKESKQGLEIYIAGMTNRYLTVTGNALHSSDLVDRSVELQTILDRYMKRNTAEQQPHTEQPLDLWQYVGMPQRTAADLSDRELIDRAKNAGNGSAFTALWNGDISVYPSHSEADQALCNMLAFWTNKDAGRIDRLFRQSGLMRDKWNRRQSGTTYGNITISKAISSCSNGYIPQRESQQRNEWTTGNDSALPGTKTAQRGVESPTDVTADYMQYYRACATLLKDPEAGKPGMEYLHRRGISPETAAAYLIGFDPAADPIAAPGDMGTEHKPHPCPRIIIPTSKMHYIGLSTDPDTPAQFAKLNPNREKGASAPAIFNTSAFYAQDVQEIFVTMGAIDALSIMEAGAPAIALNSAANAAALVKQLEARRTAATLILCLDNDNTGKKATETLKEGLTRLNISFVTADICGGSKDPNEALTADRQAFTEAIEQARHKAAAKPDNTAYYIDVLMKDEIEKFSCEKQTGFSYLDRKTGGLYAGLYTIAATSSLGKTTFALQLADQLAERGHDVLFFSLEQSRLELVCKSLARRTAQADPAHCVGSLAIRKGAIYPQVMKAIEAYKESVADRMSIIEGNFSCDIAFVRNRIRDHVRRNGTRPVVFIDYLQILEPAEEQQWRPSTKESIDIAVKQLKRLSRELELTIFVISSVNRANYLTPIDFESLKESGGIEYTCDVVWGLQFQCLNEDLFSKKEGIKEKRERIKAAKAENPRKIELCCLKNRYGQASFSCYFDYYPENDLFVECQQPPEPYQQRKAGKKL